MNKLIKIKENYYVIDDSEIKEDDYYLVLEEGEYVLYNLVSETNGKNPLKITHSTQEGIGEQLNLNDIEELVNGYSIREMAEIDAHLVWNDETTFENEQRELNGHIIGFIEGFKAHKELSKDKLFTVDDLKNAFKAGNEGNGGSMYNRVKKYNDFDNYVTRELGFVWDVEKGYILLPPTEWNIEFQNGKIILV